MYTIILNVYGTGRDPIKDLGFSIEENTSIIRLLSDLQLNNMLPKRFLPMDDFQDLIVFVNHENIMPKEWPSKILNNGDRVLILTALAGG